MSRTRPTPIRPRRRWWLVPVGLVVVGTLALPAALAQNTGGATGDATATPPTPPHARMRDHDGWRGVMGPDGAFMLRGPRGGVFAGGPARTAPEGMSARIDRMRERMGERGRDAFARWLDADPAAGPVVPGLIGAVPDGTTVRLAFWDGAPDADGQELATLVFVGGETDVALFRTQVREAATGASHVVIDVIGRLVALPTLQEDAGTAP